MTLMKPRTIQWIWLLLVLLAISLGGGAAALLRVESQRIREISDRLLAEKESALLESLSIVVSETESGLMDSLSAFPETDLEGNLRRWTLSNPFVGGTFIRAETQAEMAFSIGLAAEYGTELSGVFAGIRPNVARRKPERGGVPDSFNRRKPSTGEVAPAPLAAAQEEPKTEDRLFPEDFPDREEEASAPPTSNLAETRERVRQVTKEAYFEQRAIEEQNRQMARVEGKGFEVEPEARPEVAASASLPEAEFGTRGVGDDLIPGGTDLKSTFSSGRTDSAVSGPSRSEWEWLSLGGGPHLVGQFQPYPGADLRGVIVDPEVLFNALEESLPEGGGKLLRSAEGSYPGIEAGSGLYRDLSNRLFPGARLFIPRESGDVFNRSFWVLSGMLILVLTLALFFGGTLLVWLARRAALDAMRKTDFLSNISHELKTPLTTIRMYAELLEDGRVASEAKQRRYYRTIGSETQRLSRLVHNILQFSALQKGKSRLRPQPLDLAEWARSVCEGQEVRFNEAGLRLLPCLPEGKIEVTADPDAVEQGLLNLLDNAIKYAAEGEVVSCRLSVEDGFARLTVEDCGPGIPKEQQEKIFEAFHRIDDSLTSSKPGSGLGLSITLSLFRQMGGDLRYEPNEPKGSRFHLELPLNPN